MNNMKRFLYYNQDSINSFLAQIEQGLLVKDSSSEEDAKNISNSIGTQVGVTGDLAAKVLSFGATLQGSLHGNESFNEVSSNLIKSVQEKVLHDYAFEHVCNYVINNNLVNHDDLLIGDVVLVEEILTLFDFEYFQSLYSSTGPIKFSNEQTQVEIQKKIDEIVGNTPKGSQSSTQRTIIKELKKQISDAEAERIEIENTIKAIRNTLPYNRFATTSNMLVPLDDKYFRDDPNIVAFKYGGKISVFGYVTNIIYPDNPPIRSNNFAPIYDTINQIMVKIFEDQKVIYIIHPIALFY